MLMFVSTASCILVCMSMLRTRMGTEGAGVLVRVPLLVALLLLTTFLDVYVVELREN
jgi:hypothetical protein